MTVISSTSLEISWKEVPETERNGNITHYEILYTPVNAPLLEQQPKISITGGPVLDSILENLEEFTKYSVSVRAVTIVGSGPPSPPQMNQTEEDGKQMSARCMSSQYHLSFECLKENGVSLPAFCPCSACMILPILNMSWLKHTHNYNYYALRVNIILF